jgi:hypothetical protein
MAVFARAVIFDTLLPSTEESHLTPEAVLKRYPLLAMLQSLFFQEQMIWPDSLSASGFG